MKKIFLILPDDIPDVLCGKGYADAFIAAGFFVEKAIYSELEDDKIINFSPNYVLFFDFDKKSKKLIDTIYKKNNDTIFIFYLLNKADKTKQDFIKKLKKVSYKNMVFTADKENLNLADEIIYLPVGINAKKYKTDISGYKNGISIISNPENPKVLDLFEQLNQNFEKISLYCDETEYMSSIETDRFNNFSEETKLDYKNSYKGSVSTSKERAKVFSESYINIILTNKIVNGIDFSILEAASSSGIVFCESFPEIERLFESGHEIETFDNFETLIQKIEFYIKYPFVGQSLGLNARRAAINNHSVYDRVRQMIRIIDKKFNKKENDNE